MPVRDHKASTIYLAVAIYAAFTANFCGKKERRYIKFRAGPLLQRSGGGAFTIGTLFPPDCPDRCLTWFARPLRVIYHVHRSAENVIFLCRWHSGVVQLPTPRLTSKAADGSSNFARRERRPEPLPPRSATTKSGRRAGVAERDFTSLNVKVIRLSKS